LRGTRSWSDALPTARRSAPPNTNGQETLSQQKPERIFQTALDLLSHQQYGAAYQAFTDFQKLTQPSDYRYADAQYYQAFCALNLYHADGEKQLEDYIAANPMYPRAITAYYDLANFFYTEKNYTKASGYFSKVDFRICRCRIFW